MTTLENIHLTVSLRGPWIDPPSYFNPFRKTYVVFRGRSTGFHSTWDTVASDVNGFPNNIHQKYNTWAIALEAWYNHQAYNGLPITAPVRMDGKFFEHTDQFNRNESPLNHSQASVSDDMMALQDTLSRLSVQPQSGDGMTTVHENHGSLADSDPSSNALSETKSLVVEKMSDAMPPTEPPARRDESQVHANPNSGSNLSGPSVLKQVVSDGSSPATSKVNDMIYTKRGTKASVEKLRTQPLAHVGRRKPYIVALSAHESGVFKADDAETEDLLRLEFCSGAPGEIFRAFYSLEEATDFYETIVAKEGSQ